MSSSTLMAHTPGSVIVTREDLDRIEPPAGTTTWYPTKHAAVLDAVGVQLADAGFQIRRTQLAVAKGGARLFATLDLASQLAEGVALSVGIRNSNDQSFPLGFCAGNRVFVCDNMAFASDLTVTRKHTRFGSIRYTEAIANAVRSLASFQASESVRIRRYQYAEITDRAAESVMLRAFEQDIVSSRTLPLVLQEWRTPTFEEFAARTVWSLLNAFTWALADKAKKQPQLYAATTMRLQGLIDSELLSGADDLAIAQARLSGPAPLALGHAEPEAVPA
jgi:hypothetical protein